MPPRKPPDPPRGPPGNGSGGDSQEQFKALLREFFSNEVLPNLNRHQEEVIEAHIAKLREEVSPEVVAEKAAQLMAPKFSQDMQAIVNALRDRMADVEAKVTSTGGRQVSGETRAAPASSGAASSPDGQGLLALIETGLDMAVTKFWPLWMQQQMWKGMGEYGGLIPLAQHIQQTNPVMGQLMANILAPNQLLDMMYGTMPNVLTQGMIYGMKAKSLAQALSANPNAAPGGGAWPGTPSSGSPASSSRLGVTRDVAGPGSQPGAPGQSGSVSMAQRSKPKLKLRTKPGPKKQEPRASEPASAPARSLREALG